MVNFKRLSILICFCLIFTVVAPMNTQIVLAETKSTTTSWKSSCDKNKWPYKNKPLSDYNPCLVYTTTTFFSADELSKISADLGIAGAITALGVAAWEKIAKVTLTKTGYGLLATGAISAGAELMARHVKSKNLKGWNIVHKYNYEVQYGKPGGDLFPVKKWISIEWIPV
ncbi:hypothetical protein [Brevibacillus laterosporus]|uniref:hypothetical protein n=1 Tax=Brevibacillus laterosporus TaxID=1465 RepID=UPI00264A810D|nr:hypothetical protein [Brevibacillus laterosporus]MDN9012826.1 hypothetical protein [Brevibacillus laterosporus]MDO0943924.1 hypothetical protein [Brevibacillus laterosporus]